MPSFKTLDDLPSDLRGKRVLVRVDLNVPMQDGAVSDATRLQAVLPTVLELSDRGAIVLLLSHFGRPRGQRRPDMSTALLVRPLSDLAGRSVRFIEDCAGPDAERAVTTMTAGSIGVLENTRFHAGEEANDPTLAKAIAALGDYYVNDAFSAAHRAHASTEGVAHLLPSFAGRAMEAELKALEAALGNPERPVAAVVGGAGDGFLDAVRASGADVYVTADLRHHPALEAREEARGGTPYLVDAGHWATEWLWLRSARAELLCELSGRGSSLNTDISTLRTDPWDFLIGAAASDGSSDITGGTP